MPNILYAANLVISALGNWKFRGSLLALATALSLVFVAQASAFTATPTRTFPFGGNTTVYGTGHDGTFWRAETSGAVTHVDDEGNNLGGSFNTGMTTYGLAYYGGRVWVSTPSGSKLVGVDTAGVQPLVTPDSGTLSRLGGTQRAIRASSNGVILAALGQDNKIAGFDISNTTYDMYYKQFVFGLGVAKNPGDPAPKTWDTCVFGSLIPVSGSGDSESLCGSYSGWWGSTGEYTHGLGRPEDIAFGYGGSLFVTEANANRVTHVTQPEQGGGRIIANRFGSGPGAAAGQLSYPQNVARQPGTDYIYVTELGNQRISVFTYGGAYIASFGYGVLTGANQFEVCGIGYGQCRAGVTYQTNPKSYWGRIDFVDGQLYAQMPLVGQMQVFDVGGPAGTDPIPPAAVNPITKAEKIRLNASSTKIKKGKKVTLTGKLRDHDPAVCPSRKVLFQVQDGRSWDNVKTIKVDKKKCTAVLKRKISKKQTFRAILINSANQASIATSPKVAISIKKK